MVNASFVCPLAALGGCLYGACLRPPPRAPAHSLGLDPCVTCLPRESKGQRCGLKVDGGRAARRSGARAMEAGCQVVAEGDGPHGVGPPPPHTEATAAARFAWSDKGHLELGTARGRHEANNGGTPRGTARAKGGKTGNKPKMKQTEKYKENEERTKRRRSAKQQDNEPNPTPKEGRAGTQELDRVRAR